MPGDSPPRISVIVPVFNAGRYLTECLDSILSQEGPDFEVVLVDDGSTDGSGAVCDDYAKRDARIAVVHTPNAGTYAARNTALDRVAGEFVTFVDADDWLEPGALAALDAVQRESDADFARGGMRMVFDVGEDAPTMMGQDGFLPARKAVAAIEDVGGRPRVCFSGGVCATIIRREFLVRHGLRFPDVLSGGDILMNLAIAALPHVYRAIGRDIYVYRRQTANSLTLTFSPTKRRRLAEQLHCLDVLCAFLERENSPERVSAALGNQYVNGMFRYFVVCAAFALMGEGEARGDFFRAFFDPAWRRYLPYYDSGSARGKSRLLPFLARRGWSRAAFFLCRRKAAKRYAREITAWRAAAPAKS